MSHTQVSGLKIRKKEPVQLPDIIKIYMILLVVRWPGWMDGWMYGWNG